MLSIFKKKIKGEVKTLKPVAVSKKGSGLGPCEICGDLVGHSDKHFHKDRFLAHIHCIYELVLKKVPHGKPVSKG